MKTDIMLISSDGSNMDAALEQVEKAAAYKGLSEKNAMCLRLLAEETMAMVRAIAGNVNGEFHSDTTRNSVKLDNIAEGSKIYVRAANSMGGLGAKSNEIVTVAAADTSVTDSATTDSIPPTPGDSVTVPGDSTTPVDSVTVPNDSTISPGDTSSTRINREHYADQPRKSQHLYTIKGQRVIMGRKKVMRVLYGK